MEEEKRGEREHTPQIVERARRRNAEYEARNAPPPEPRAPRPGTVVILTCADCSCQAGFRAVEPFLAVRARASAFRLGWRPRPGGIMLCPDCSQKDSPSC